MKKLLLLTLVFIATSSAWAGAYVGQLVQPEGPEGQVYLQTKTRQIPLSYSPDQAAAVISLVNQAPFVEVKGIRRRATGQIEIAEIPTMMSGNLRVSGKLIRRENYNGPYPFEINGMPVKIGATKLVNGAAFDDQSSSYFEGRDVFAIGTKDQYGAFVLESVVRADVWSTSQERVVDPELANDFKKFADAPIPFVIDFIKGKIKSKSPAYFKGTLFAKPDSKVEAGDSVLIISASGREADSMGGVNGHFASGQGRVDANGNISDGDMFNVYVTNEKQIKPGDVKMADYFGHVISGQNNYRPTYTLTLYGVPQEKIQQVRDELDKFYQFFRDSMHPTKITCVVNCATLGGEALSDIGIYGIQRDGTSSVDANSPKEFVHLSNQTALPKTPGFVGQVNYLNKTKRAEFMPGPAMVSLLENLQTLVANPELGISRADFIFSGQTPSSRPVGGPPSMGVWNELKMQGKVGFNLIKSKFKKFLSGVIKKKTPTAAVSSANQCEAYFN